LNKGSRRIVFAGLFAALVSSSVLAQGDLPNGEKLTGRAAERAFTQVADQSFMAPAVKVLRQHYPDEYELLRETFFITAREEGVRRAIRGVSSDINEMTVSARPRLATASEDDLVRLLESHVETLRMLRAETPGACAAFAEWLTPPPNAPSDEASGKIFETIALALQAAAHNPEDGETYEITSEDRALLRPDAENSRVFARSGNRGRCQNFITRFGTVLAQPPARAARIYATLLDEAFSKSK